MNVGKAHQRKIREERALHEAGENFFGCYWKELDIDIKKAVCRAIDYQTAKKIIKEYEWLGTMGTTQFHYGIFFDGVCGGVVCFGYFQSPTGYAGWTGEKHGKNGIQLSRGACVHWAHKHAGSKLIAFGLREMAKKGYKYCIAFSDEDAGEIGTLYQATNWYYLGKNKDHKDFNIVYKDTGKMYCNSRDFHKKGLPSGRQAWNKIIAEKPYLAIYEIKPKSKYIKLLGSKYENREIMKTLSKFIKPYIKRNGI